MAPVASSERAQRATGVLIKMSVSSVKRGVLEVHSAILRLGGFPEWQVTRILSDLLATEASNFVSTVRIKTKMDQ
jgi:hypothetical protein